MTDTTALPDLAVIDAWLDGEPAPPADVDAALSTAEGRAYAMDVMALRRVCLHEPAATPAVRASWWRPLAAAAAIVVTALGGFAVGQRSAEAEAPASTTLVTATADTPAAPEPTRVIQFDPSTWRETTGGN